MQDNTTIDHELDDRDVKALTQYLTVVPIDDADGLYEVTSQSGKEYIVDLQLGACECPDFGHRQPSDGCKHVRRVAFETGARELPAWVDREALPSDFRAHVDHDDQDPDAPGACALATDGGQEETPREECWCAEYDCPCFEHFEVEG